MSNAASTSFPAVVIGFPNKSYLREKAFIFAYSTKYHLPSIMLESQWQELGVADIYPQSGRREELRQILGSFSSFQAVQDPQSKEWSHS